MTAQVLDQPVGFVSMTLLDANVRADRERQEKLRKMVNLPKIIMNSLSA
jgi:hypothetical protein